MLTDDCVYIHIGNADNTRMEFPEFKATGYYLYIGSGTLLEDDLYDNNIDILLGIPGMYSKFVTMNNGYMYFENKRFEGYWFDKYSDAYTVMQNIKVYMWLMHGVIVN